MTVAPQVIVQVGRIRREAGTAGIAVRLVQRVVPRALLHVEWFAVLDTVPRAGAAPLEEAMPGAAWAGEGDTARLGALVRGERAVRDRLRDGDVAAYYEEDGRVVAQVFLRRDAYLESGVRFDLDPDEMWLYDAWVAEDRRGERISSRLVRAVIDDIGRGGVRHCMSAVDHLNRASVRSGSRRGARTIGSVLSAHALGLTLTSVRGVGRRRAWALHRRPRRIRLIARGDGS